MKRHLVDVAGRGVDKQGSWFGKSFLSPRGSMNKARSYMGGLGTLFAFALCTVSGVLGTRGL